MLGSAMVALAGAATLLIPARRRTSQSAGAGVADQAPALETAAS
ncbi:hypothetical protein P3T35_007678 [Kitasatospora sp. GP30]|nr:hypothetical protein [Kitasatospora sp. GP30]MDH6145621.1 hypothetical protein [Kitasatospora sp. GP30]